MITSTPTKATPTGITFSATDLTMLLVVTIWGANFSIVKLGLLEIPPLVFAALRFSIAGVLLWIVLRLREGKQTLPDRKTLGQLIWIGVVGNTLYQICFTYGLRITTAANAALLIATTPVLVALLGAFLKIEKLRRNSLIGIGLAFLGVILVLSARGLHFTSEGLLGDVLLLGCAFFWTLYTLGVRSLGGGLSPLAITTWTMITGIPGLLLVSLPEMLSVNWASISFGAWAGLGYATVLGIVVAYVLWNNSVRVAGSTKTAIFGSVTPLIATLIAWPMLGEFPTGLQALGALFIIGGVLSTRWGRN